MKTYIGTKIITAVAMTRGAYNEYRGWQLPANENGADEGFLVEYRDGGAANDSRHAGYISWSPKEVFEGSYRETTGLPFGLAIEAMKKGHKVARAGWNGKGMWLVLSHGSSGKRWDMKEGSDYAKAGLSSTVINPHIDMKTATGEMQPGWLASQTDMLATDWAILE